MDEVLWVSCELKARRQLFFRRQLLFRLLLSDRRLVYGRGARRWIEVPLASIRDAALHKKSPWLAWAGTQRAAMAGALRDAAAVLTHRDEVAHPYRQL
jgi:hypothetical protein